MSYLERTLMASLEEQLGRSKSILLLGARQTGKTTLINRIAASRLISLAQPKVRVQYERNPGALTGEIEALAEQMPSPLVIVDEVQKVPELLDAVQDLIDRGIARFILTGSSARKLKNKQLNLLPGRVVVLRLDPLTSREIPFQDYDLNELLLYGSLPGIVTADNKYRELDLESYITTYLEEEIRKESVVRNIGAFVNFLAFAAAESGLITNFRNISQQLGVSHTTISAYYQILEDCLVAEKIEPLPLGSKKRQFVRGVKYLFYDLGVRRMCAGEGDKLPLKYYGLLFEQFIGLELIRNARFVIPKPKIYYWRNKQGAEVDWIIVKGRDYIPIEVKWTESPTLRDARHLQTFLTKYSPDQTGYIVCRCSHRIKLATNIYAIPWRECHSLVNE